MFEQQPMDTAQLGAWLTQAGIEHYLCDHCEGIHLRGVQELEGVVESRLFQEDWGLLISTEFLLRPTAILAAVAELGRLNIDYPTLKLFLDIVDDAIPQLVAGSSVLTKAGLTEVQFALYVSTSLEMMKLLGGELLQLEYLMSGEDDLDPPIAHPIH